MLLPVMPLAVLTTKEFMRTVTEIKPEWLVRVDLPCLHTTLKRGFLRLAVMCCGADVLHIKPCLWTFLLPAGGNCAALLL